MIFPKRPTFGASLPYKPLRGRRLKRRMAMLREAAVISQYLPAENEATHVLMQGQFDLMVLLAVVLGSLGGRCQTLRIATLSFNERNLTELNELLRTDKVGRIELICSEFFRDKNRDVYGKAKADVGSWPGRWSMAAARSHAKVFLIDSPYKLVIEGSANLRTNSNWEQIALIRDDGLHDWHAGWIDQLVTDNGKAAEKETGKPSRRSRKAH